MTDDASRPSPIFSTKPARRFLALSLPYLPTDRLHRQTLGKSWRSAPEKKKDASSHPGKRNVGGHGLADDICNGAPLAVVAKVKNALRLVALNEAAEKLGLIRGQALADARAMIPALAVTDENIAADAALLDEIADWAERYTPLVALDDVDGLMLEITGCAHLFRGEEALVADLSRRLLAQGFFARAAIADTPGAASAAARFTDVAVVPQGQGAAMLEPLPLAALRIDRETVSALDRVGLKRIGQIVGGPRAPLAARFGIELIRKLDQALGIDEEAINPRREAPTFITERRFAEPIAREEDVAATLSSLAATLGQSLETHGEGARRLEFTLFRVDGVVTRIAVGASRPIRSPKFILALFREKFVAMGDDLDAGFGFDMARLSVTASAAVDPAQIDLTGDATAEADVDGLIDRIGARLGLDSVGRIVPRETHIPERAEILVTDPGYRTKDKNTRPPDTELTRPLRLFAHPELVEAIAEVPDGPPVHFRWRRALYRVARAEGPERIAAEWWRADGFTRDYFRVEDSAGHRFWLFREGLYGRELGNPRWYMHGVFA
jgi:protein ImuB